MLYALLGTYIAVVAIAAVVLMHLRPNWSRLRLAAVSATPGPLLLLVLLAIGFGGALLDGPAPDDGASIDARYHAMSAYLFLATGVPVLFAVGVLTSWLTAGMLRR